MYRIALVTDSPYVHSGYGVSAKQFIDCYIHDESRNYELVVLSFGDSGSVHQRDGVLYIPNPRIHFGDLFFNETLPKLQECYALDAIVTLKDPYVFAPNMLAQLKYWFPFVPIDTEPISPILTERLAHCARPIAFSHDGLRQLRASGFVPLYAPLGFWRADYYRIEQHEARKMLGLPEDSFIAVFVGANQSVPSRKSIPEILLAWREFVRRYPSALLYMHTHLVHPHGLDVLRLIDDLGIGEHVRCTDRDEYALGFSAEKMRALYNAANVVVNPSTGGGFERVILEAQACGTPVIATHFTAMRDMVWAGVSLYVNEVPQSQKELDKNLQAYRLRPRPVDILNALQYIAELDEAQRERLRESAMRGASAYEFSTLYDKYWKTTFNMIVDTIAQKRTYVRGIAMV
ncbi:MAG: glycosyltransferase [Chloroflexi bacterium]|nr:MAG: glycosyltransferase [Chloroflexota bacterium]